jgi:hypothetical protein
LSRDTLSRRADWANFFPLCFRPSAVHPGQRVPSSFPYPGAPTWLHQTRLAVLSPPGRRVPRPLGGGSTTSQPLCSLVPSYAKGWLNGGRAPVRRRRGGGAAPGNWTRLSPASTGAGAEVQSKATGSGQKGRCAPYACNAAATYALPSTTGRLSPGWSSEAFGASAPLP